MTPDELRAVVLRHLTRIAPEADVADLRPDLALRDQLDIDSMDFLNFIIALHKDLGVSIPERDYAQLTTLNGIVDYLAAATR